MKLTFASWKAVHLQCLDENKTAINNAVATGVIIQEKDGVYLYTCWHVATGFDPDNIEIKPNKPIRAYLKARMMGATQKPGYSVIEGSQEEIISLYEDIECKRPRWHQDKGDIPNADLNSVGLRVPDTHDVIRVKVSGNFANLKHQRVHDKDKWIDLCDVTERVMIVGYPYGFSAFSPDDPFPLVFTRGIASMMSIKGRRRTYLDGSAAPGMSGSPVFVVKDDVEYLYGLYTGIIYPDVAALSKNRLTALGVVCPLVLWWSVHKLLPKLIGKGEA